MTGWRSPLRSMVSIPLERDTQVDNATLFSGGTLLYCPEVTGIKVDLKDGVLLEVAFDDVAPNVDKDISSWAYDYASSASS